MRALGSSASARAPSSSSTCFSSYHQAGRIGDRLLLDGPRQQLLGERRAVVGRVGLGADHPHRPLVAAAAQRLGAALRREAAADDQDSVVVHHASSGLGIGNRAALVGGRGGLWSRAPSCVRSSLSRAWRRPRRRGRRRARRSPAPSSAPTTGTRRPRRRCRRRRRGPGRAGRRRPSPGGPCARAARRSACGSRS